MPAARREGGYLSCNVATDISALGSCIFQIGIGKKPYKGLDDDDVEKRFANGEYPGLKGILFAEVIRKCWYSEFESAEAVMQALSMEARNIESDLLSKALQ